MTKSPRLRLQDPSQKYRPFKPLDLPNRQWPSKVMEKPPRWLATDLRDGNQSNEDPMVCPSHQRFQPLKAELLIAL